MLNITYIILIFKQLVLTFESQHTHQIICFINKNRLLKIMEAAFKLNYSYNIKE